MTSRVPTTIVWRAALALGCLAAPVLAAAGPQEPPGAAALPPAEAFTYDPGGRRDPFVSLVTRGTDLRAAANRPAGLPGLLIGEVTVRGIMQSKGTYVAMLQAPDSRTYIVRANDRLLDGTIRAIAPDAVVFLQDVHDPLSLVKQREVRKTLRILEEGK